MAEGPGADDAAALGQGTRVYAGDRNMITVTPGAARQIRIAAAQADAVELRLRLAARRDTDGALHYAMGFDNARNDDIALVSGEIALVVSPQHSGLLEGMTLDFVEFEPGDFRFIFINPNDVATAVDPKPAGCGGCGCEHSGGA